MNKLIALIGILLLNGCASNFTWLPSVTQNFIKIDSFMIDEVIEADTGDVMLSIVKWSYYPGFVSTVEHQEPSESIFTYPYIPLGAKWACSKKLLNTKDYVCLSNSVERVYYYGKSYSAPYALIVNQQGEPIGDGMCSLDDCASFSERIWEKKPQNFLVPQKALYSKNFSQEMTYYGKTGSTIKLGYREYTKNIARPAFNQELTYDLSESKIIGFKGMSIEVLLATNSNIKFIVRSPMR